MATSEELPQAGSVREYKISFKTATWITMLVVVVMAGLYAIIGLPPSLHGYYTDMYFHSIGIGIAALAVYLVVTAFDLRKYEPDMDFPLHYRTLIAVLLAAFGAVFFLSPDLDAALRPVPMLLIVGAFIFLADVGGALLIELWLLPRKLTGAYHMVVTPPVRASPISRFMHLLGSHLSANYVLRMFPLTRRDLQAYRKMNASYWLALIAVASAFVAGLIGIVNLWVLTFGPSIFAGYISFQGSDAAGFLAQTLDPHSHDMALAIMAGVIAIAAQRFGVLNVSGLKRHVARVGLWVSSFGVIAMTVVMLAIAFFSFSPPTLFQGGPGGANGIAGDDVTMTVIAIGALILLVPMALTPLGTGHKRSWRDAVRFSLLASWILAVVVNVIAGLYIEMHHDVFQSTLAVNDAVYGQLQAMFGVFVLTGVALALLAVDTFGIERTPRRVIGWVAGVGMAVATLGAFSWALIDPTVDSASFWTHILGVVIIGVGVLVAAVAVRSAAVDFKSPLEERKPVPHEPKFLLECSWTPERREAVMAMFGKVAEMAQTGQLPEGFNLLWIRAVSGGAEAFCAWQAPDKGSLEALVVSLNPPGKHVVHELQTMA